MAFTLSTSIARTPGPCHTPGTSRRWRWSSRPHFALCWQAKRPGPHMTMQPAVAEDWGKNTIGRAAGAPRGARQKEQ
jgi:hypothetical protein